MVKITISRENVRGLEKLDTEKQKEVQIMRSAVLCFILIYANFLVPNNLLANGKTTKTMHGPFAKYIKYAVIHHTEVRASTNSNQLNSVNIYHKNKFASRSFLGKWVGYNWFCDVDGTLTQTRLFGEKTAAQLAHNFDSESICFAGDFDIDFPTPAQVHTLKKWLEERSELTIVFHRDLADRTCPGRRVTRRWLRSISPNLHIGTPGPRVSDKALIEQEHDQDRLMYLEVAEDESEVAKFQRSKLEAILKRINRRKHQKKRRD